MNIDVHELSYINHFSDSLNQPGIDGEAKIKSGGTLSASACGTE